MDTPVTAKGEAARQCARCTAPIEGTASSCRHCGHEVIADELPLEALKSIVSEESRAQVKSHGAAAQTSPRAAAAGDSQQHMFSQWPIAIVGGVGALVGISMMVALMWLQPQTPTEPADAGQPASPPSAAVIVESAETPTWMGRRQAVWARDGSKTIEFELQANSDVPVWMSRVRPSLVVRCVSRSTEVFVAIRSSASIESQAGSHTVRFQIDDDPEVIQKWSDSVSSQELFAPNAVTLARRLAGARRMRFGFTPYNAKPVMAEFSVQGFDKLAGLVASTCGWRLDGPAPQAPRSARLN
jgi:hypothetical protein